MQLRNFINNSVFNEDSHKTSKTILFSTKRVVKLSKHFSIRLRELENFLKHFCIKLRKL